MYFPANVSVGCIGGLKGGGLACGFGFCKLNKEAVMKRSFGTPWLIGSD